MPNDWSKNPFEILFAENKNIQALVGEMEWLPANAGDDLLVRDSYGHILWKVRSAAGAPNAESYGIEKKRFDSWIKGINIEVIDAGTLLIYCK